MTRPGHPDDPWVHPWRPGLPQALCVGRNCTPVEGVGRRVVAVTLTQGLCVTCASVVGDDEQMGLS